MNTRLFSTICWCALFVLLSRTGSGQIRGIESPVAEKTNQEVIQQLINNATWLKQQQQGDSALLVYLEALRQSAAISYQDGIDTALYYLSYDLRQLGFAPYYGRIMEKTLQYAKNTTIDYYNLASLMNYYGFYLHWKGEYYPAMLAHQKALKTLSYDTTAAIRKLKGRIFYGISTLCMALDQFNQAGKWLADLELIAQPSQDTPSLILVNQIKGQIYRKAQNTDSAYYYLNRAYTMGKAFLKNDTTPCDCLSGPASALSVILIDRYEADRALKIINSELSILGKVVALKKDQGYAHYSLDNMMLRLRFLKAYATYQLKDFNQAKEEALHLLEILPKEGHGESKGNIYSLLAAMYADQHRFKDAFFYQSKYIELNESVTESAKTKAIEAQYEAQKNQALAQKQQLILRQQSRLREQKIWIGSSVLGILLLGVALIAIYRNNRNKQKLQSASMLSLQQEQKITQLQAKVEGEEQERSRIARELHDGIVSQLMALKLNINALQNNGKPVIFHHELNDAALQLEEATQDLRKTAHNLMPDLLQQQGLALSVAALCEKTSRTTPLDVAFQAYGKLPKLQQETELTLYRMIQELIQNALKHADATQLLVQLSCRDNSLNITVEDNGKGFPVARLEQNNREGVGLSNIKRRAEILKGQVDIKSRHGVGTMVYLEFELKNLV